MWLNPIKVWINSQDSDKQGWRSICHAAAQDKACMWVPLLIKPPAHQSVVICLFLCFFLALHVWGPVLDFTREAPEVSNQQLHRDFKETAILVAFFHNSFSGILTWVLASGDPNSPELLVHPIFVFYVNVHSLQLTKCEYKLMLHFKTFPVLLSFCWLYPHWSALQIVWMMIFSISVTEVVEKNYS